MKIFISGQKFFGLEVLRTCIALGHEVVGVCAPLDDKRITPYARALGIPVLPAGTLTHETMPAGADLGIAAHSFDYIGKKTRYKTALGWIGYHPSLLPRHRGRSAIEWAIRMRDAVTGGTVFWLNAGIDRGDIILQDWCFIDPALYSRDSRVAARELWEEELCPMGVRLVGDALRLIASGNPPRIKQDARFSTFEPSTETKDIYRPDLLMLAAANPNAL